MSAMIATPPVFAALEPAKTVLLAGADVYAGLPLALALREQRRGPPGNLSFAPLTPAPTEQWLGAAAVARKV